MTGKGSRPRKIKDKKKFDANWDQIFNKNKKGEKNETIKKNS